MIWAWILLEVEGHTRTDIKLLLVKGHWQLCGELTSVGYDCKTSVEAAGILNERMVIMQVVWFVGCILKGKPVGFIDGFDVSLEGCISRMRGRSLPEPVPPRGIEKKREVKAKPALSLEHIRYLGSSFQLSVPFSVSATLSLSLLVSTFCALSF